MRQDGFIEVIAELQPGVRFTAYQPLQWKGEIAQAGGEKWILTVALHRKAGQGMPLGANKVRLRIRGQSSLIQPRQENGRARGLCQASHVAAVEFDQTAWTGEGRLTRRNLIAAQSNGAAASGKRNGPGRYVSAAMRHLESESVSDFVAFRFVHLHQRHFLGLVGDGLSRSGAGPVKDAQIVRATSRSQ